MSAHPHSQTCDTQKMPSCCYMQKMLESFDGGFIVVLVLLAVLVVVAYRMLQPYLADAASELGCLLRFKDRWYVSNIFFNKVFLTSSIWWVFGDKFSIWYRINFTTKKVIIANSRMVRTADFKSEDPGCETLSDQYYCLYFCHYAIFVQQPGIMKIRDSKLDLVRYPQFCSGNKMECKQTGRKFSRKMI